MLSAKHRTLNPEPCSAPLAGSARNPIISPYSVLLTSAMTKPIATQAGRKLLEAASTTVEPDGTASRQLQATASTSGFTVLADSTGRGGSDAGGVVPITPPWDFTSVSSVASLPVNTTSSGSGLMAAAVAFKAIPGQMLCFTVQVGACGIANPCCSTDLNKIELLIGELGRLGFSHSIGVRACG